MDQHEKDNWLKVQKYMEEKGATDNMFYKRAVAINRGEDDPLEDKLK